MNKKKLLLLLGAILLLFTLTGCNIPKDENERYVLIALSEVDVPNQLITSFSQMMDTEGIFSAIFVYPLSQLINWLTPYSNVGVAILIVALVINGVLLLFTLKQNVAMQKMQMMQPEIEKIQRKYEGKNDQASKMRMGQEIQNLYSKYHVNPLSSLVVMFIQFPLLIAMYHAVQRAYAVAYGTFMGVSLEITPLEGIQSGRWMYLVFFLVMIAMQTLSITLPMILQKRKAKKEAELHHRPYRPTKNPMGSTMYIMLGMVTIIAIGWPTAMTFYWTISSFIQIVKTLLVQAIMNRQKGV